MANIIAIYTLKNVLSNQQIEYIIRFFLYLFIYLDKNLMAEK